MMTDEERELYELRYRIRRLTNQLLSVLRDPYTLRRLLLARRVDALLDEVREEAAQ